MESDKEVDKKIEERRQRRRVDFNSRFFKNLVKQIQPKDSNTPTSGVTSGTNFGSQNSETAKKLNTCPIQTRSSAHSGNTKINNDTSHNSNDRDKIYSEKSSNIQDSSKESSYKTPKLRKQNQTERKHSQCELQAKENTQDEESENCIEFSEVKHQRNIIEGSEGLKISFKNELPSKPASSTNSPLEKPISSLSPTSDPLSSLPSVSSPPPPVDSISSIKSLHSLSSVSSSPPSGDSISSIHSLPSSASPPPPVFNSSPTQPVSTVSLRKTLIPTSEVKTVSLRTTLIPGSPVNTVSLRTTLISVSPKNTSLTVSPITNLPTSPKSENSDLTDCDNSKLLLSSEEKCFIPPPVLPSSINSCDSASTSLERNGTFSHNGSVSSGELLPDDEVYPLITDPEHLEAISNFILEEVKERKVDCSSANKVVRDLNWLFKDYFEGNVIDLYGSYNDGLAITTSDINLVVMADASIKKSFMFEVYKILSSELEKYHVHPFEEGLTTYKTKINFSHPDTGINCQLAYLGRQKDNVFEMGKFLKRMCRRDERVVQLIIATKIWAESLTINEVEDGKLHPIGYAVLVIHFLQNCENPILPILNSSDDNKKDRTCLPNTASIGELWMAFLRYYSMFNWKQNVVTVNSNEIVSKKSKSWENYWLAIEDPFTGQNIARSVVNSDVAEYIKACFKSTYAYFCNSPDNSSISSSNGDDQNNGMSPSCKYKFSFQQCIVEQNDETFCENCEEIDDICDECKKKIYVQPMASVPKMTDSFLNLIKTALTTVYDKYILTEEEINERKQFVKYLQSTIRRVYQDADLNLFGSSANGFGFKKSDLDICVTFKKEKINSASVLKDIRFLLRKNRDFQHVVVIFRAQIPIIKFFYQPKGWRGDISLDNTLAVHNSELLYTYSLIDERCKILGCALKLLAKKALISEVTEKALSSYSYLNMVIHFLQQVEPPVLPVLQDNKFRQNNFSLDDIIENCNVWFCRDIVHIKRTFKSENVVPVEQLWLDLLDYYCSYNSNQFITIRQKETQYINEMKRSARLFNIQDPFIETKNLGCVVSGKKAQETKSVFDRARRLFRTPVKEFPSGVKDIEDYFFSTMSLTGRIHKEAHCDLCGKFGHEQKECKQSCFPLRRPNFRRFHKYDLYKSRNTTNSNIPMKRPSSRKQFSRESQCIRNNAYIV